MQGLPNFHVDWISPHAAEHMHDACLKASYILYIYDHDYTICN